LVRDSRTCATWPHVEGRVVSSTLAVVGREKNKTTYAPNVAYTYAVGGKQYESSRLTLTPQNSISRQSIESILARYPAGGTIRVFHDPKDPANCVLSTNPTGVEWAYPLGGVILVGVGLMMFFQRN
jgi:hypothetical protein